MIRTERTPVRRPGDADRLVAAWRPLVQAEAGAEGAAAGMEPADLEQAVWLRLMERLDDGAAPGEPASWVRAVVRAEARRARRRIRREVGYAAPEGPPPPAGEGKTEAEGRDAEGAVLAAERDRALRAAIGGLPGRCPELMSAMLHPCDPTYREIAGTLGISQGSLGPIRSRCLGCLRRMLTSEVGAPQPWGKGW